MLLFDPTEPFALLDAAAASFISRIFGREFSNKEKFAGFFGGEDHSPKSFVIDESGNEVLLSAASGASSPGRKLVAVVPLWGALSPDGRYWGTATKDFAKQVAGFMNNAQIGAVVIKIDSPGGTVTGTMEAADAIRSFRGSAKPIVASVDSMMASAATWIGTAASDVAITPSGEAGSIGVISMYADASKAWEEMGIKIDVMRTPARKARFTGVEPLSDEMRATMTSRLDEAYSQFKQAMAQNREISPANVESKFGGGEMLNAKEALDAGLVNRIATFDQVLERMFVKMEKKAASSKAMEAKAKCAGLKLEEVSN